MKNPNRYGTVTRLSGNRRRPFIVKEGVSGKQKPIGYTATREEGLMLLAQYNSCPWNLDQDRLTFAELYRLWMQQRGCRLGKSAQNAMQTAYTHCAAIEKIRYRQLKAWQMQNCIDTCGCGYATQGQIRSLFRHLDRFALELDIIAKGYSELLTTAPVTPSARCIFTNEELLTVRKHAGLPWADSLLFLLYTGFRLSEMLALRVEQIDFGNNTMTGGTKTAAGKNRIVPIHPFILPIVRGHAAESVSGYLFEYSGRKISGTQYRRFWNALMETLGMSHTPHECRHTFRSRLDSAGANKVCIDRLMGHVSQGTGERVYTHKTIEELRQNLALLTDQ